MKKIVAFGYVNLSDHWASLFYLDELSKEGMEIIYLNIDKITLKQNVEIVNHSLCFKQIVINCLKEFEDIVKSLKDSSIFIPCVTIVPEVWNLFKTLIRNNASMCYIHVGELPGSGNDTNIINLTRKLKKVFSKTVIEKTLFYFRKKRILSHLQAAFVAGSVAADFHREYGTKNIININVRDYDDSFDNKRKNTNVPLNDYCVFLDGYLPFHHDNNVMGIVIEPETYYRSINNYFEYIENRYNLDIVIAAHPKSQYETIGNKFKNRKIIKGQTGRLIKHSQFVLNHESSALTYALLLKKKMLFLTTNGINRNRWYANSIQKKADLLGCSVINIDNISEVNNLNLNEIEINVTKYNDFKYKYLTSKESENKRSKGVILNELRKLL